MTKKTLVCVAGILFMVVAWTLAADTTLKEANPKAQSKQVVVKAAKMNARGKVINISDKAVVIERSIKGNAEKMEFALEHAVDGISVGDLVKIDYSLKEGKMTASRVVKLPALKPTIKNGGKHGDEKPASESK
jgi:hypothetical protein